MSFWITSVFFFFVTDLHEWRLAYDSLTNVSREVSHATTDGQSASLSWNKLPIWGLRQEFYYCQTVECLLNWSAFSEERKGLSFTITPVPQQRSHFDVRVTWDSWPIRVKSQSNFTTGGLPLITSFWRQAPWGSRPDFFQPNTCGRSPYVTSSLTIELVIVTILIIRVLLYLGADRKQNTSLNCSPVLLYVSFVTGTCLNSGATASCVGNVLTETMPSNGPFRLSGFLTHLSYKRATTSQQPCYQAVAQQWTFILPRLLRLSAIISQYSSVLIHKM
jgi:hypothetical protein